ncbi:MAG: hypothetical protein U1F43_14215 [Myxococcota bacterium]
MAKSSANLTQISMDRDVVTITLGRAHLSVPADHIDSVIRVLEAAKLMVGRGGSSSRAAAAVAAVVAAPPAAAPRRRGRPPKNPDGAIRRSRKRVGDALAQWLRDNPGWHTTDELISVVRDNRMTDASPVRAVMIALGKQRGGVFESDGTNHWRLAGDESAGPPPTAEPKVRKKPGRKPGTGKKAGAGRGKRAPSGRRRGRPSKSSDKEGSAEQLPQVEVEATRPVRVKRGQNRKEAMLTPTELEARKNAASTVERLRDRFSLTNRAERERVRKNLFGDELSKAR